MIIFLQVWTSLNKFNQVWVCLSKSMQIHSDHLLLFVSYDTYEHIFGQLFEIETIIESNNGFILGSNNDQNFRFMNMRWNWKQFDSSGFLKVSLFQKQIFSFSFVPKTKWFFFSNFCPKDLKQAWSKMSQIKKIILIM